MKLSPIAVFTVSLSTIPSLGYGSPRPVSPFDTPAFIRTQSPSTTSGFIPVRDFWKRQQTAQLTSTVAKEPQLALNWPLLSTWSSLSEPIQLIANIPLISAGFVAIALATTLAFNDQIDVISLLVISSALFSFMAGIIELLNIIKTENSPVGRNSGASIATGAFLSSAILLKYMFLFLRLDSPTSNRTSFASNISVNRSAILKAPSWDALGAYARITKLMVLLLIITSTILELAWQVGILTNPQGFQRTLKASASLQMLLLLGLTTKNVYLVSQSEASSRADFSTTKAIGPVTVGNGIGFATQVLSLEISAFVDTPMGRFLNLMQVYFYIVDAAICCFHLKSSHTGFKRDSLVIGRKKTTSDSSSFVTKVPLPLPLTPDTRAIYFNAQPYAPPAFKSLPPGAALPEISTLSQPGRIDSILNLDRNFQSMPRGRRSLRNSQSVRRLSDVISAEKRYVVVPAHSVTAPITSASAKNTESFIVEGVPESGSAAYGLRSPTGRGAKYDRPRNVEEDMTLHSRSEKMLYTNVSMPSLAQNNTTEVKLIPTKSTQAPAQVLDPTTQVDSSQISPAGQTHRNISEVQAAYSVAPSTIFSQYYVGAYDDEPPPLPSPKTFHNPRTENVEISSEQRALQEAVSYNSSSTESSSDRYATNDTGSPKTVFLEANSSDTSSPNQKSSSGDSFLNIMAINTTESHIPGSETQQVPSTSMGSLNTRASIMSSTFSPSRFKLMENGASISWSDSDATKLFESSPTPFFSVENVQSLSARFPISPRQTQFEIPPSREDDLDRDLTTSLSGDSRALEIGKNKTRNPSSLAEDNQNLLDDTWQLPSRVNSQITTSSKLSASSHNDAEYFDEALSGRCLDRNIDVTSFIGRLTYPTAEQDEELLEPPQNNPSTASSNQSPRYDTLSFREPGSPILLSTPNHTNGTNQRESVDEFMLETLAYTREELDNLSVFTLSPTTSLQIIDSRGHPILRSFPPPPQPLVLPARQDYMEMLEETTFSNNFVPTSPREDQIITLQDPLRPGSPIRLVLPRTISASSLFDSTTAFQNPREAPKPKLM